MDGMDPSCFYRNHSKTLSHILGCLGSGPFRPLDMSGYVYDLCHLPGGQNMSGHAGFTGRVMTTRSIYIYIYIYKTVVCDRVLTLYRPCAYPGAVLRHASGPTGPRNSSRSFSPFIKSSLPGSSKSRCSRKQT